MTMHTEVGTRPKCAREIRIDGGTQPREAINQTGNSAEPRQFHPTRSGFPQNRGWFG
jgi:hypothetical protein